jgi:hypothetical protein
MQKTNSSIAGVYYLDRIPEMASGFRININNSFDFFFSYGALDRFGSGEWEIIGDNIIFNSKKWIGYDFHITESKIVESENLIIELSEINPALIPYIYICTDEKSKDWKAPDSKGRWFFGENIFDSFLITCEFCQERFTCVQINCKEHNFFSIVPKEWLFEYYFANFNLQITEDKLVGKHPFLLGNEFNYSKSK